MLILSFRVHFQCNINILYGKVELCYDNCGTYIAIWWDFYFSEDDGGNARRL